MVTTRWVSLQLSISSWQTYKVNRCASIRDLARKYARRASRRHIRAAVEASLKRLNTDYLDIYFIHHFDDVTPIEETLHTLDDLVRAGKILYPAASNFAAWQVAKALGISAKESWARF